MVAPTMRGVAVRRSRREDHTRLGWWLLTHERGLIAVVCALACAVLVAEAFYLASRWTGLGSVFNFGFLGGAAGLLLVALLTKELRLDDSRRPRRDNLLLFVVLTVLFVASDMFGVGAAPVLGAVAALAAVFPVMLVSGVLRRAGASTGGERAS